MEQRRKKKQTRLGMEARKEESLADWYSEVIVKVVFDRIGGFANSAETKYSA